MFLPDIENYILCGLALLIAGFAFWYFYKEISRKEDLEQIIHDIRVCLIAGDYKQALKLTDIEYEYEYKENE